MAVLEKLTTNINLEMSGDTKRYLVSAKQGDKATRYIVARLLNNGEPYTIPIDARAVINEKKPDGKHVYNACTFSGEYVTVELTNQMLASAGVAYCDIEIRSADNTQVITSASFEMEIEKTQRNESAILSSNEFTELERREQEIAEIEKSVVDAENERKEAEKKRDEAEKERGRELSKHNVSGDAHNDIRIKITELANKVYAFLDTDDVTLDQASEFIAYMKSNRSLIESVTNSKVNVTDIIDNLTTNVANKPLSAARGVELKGLYNELKKILDTINVPTKISQLENDSGFLTKHQDISELAKKATTLAGYGIEDGLTKKEYEEEKISVTYDETNKTVRFFRGGVKLLELSVTSMDGGGYELLLDKTLSIEGSIADAGIVGKEIERIVEMIADKMQFAPEFVNDVSECTDTSKVYVLPDGYLYSYMKVSGLLCDNLLFKGTDENGVLYKGKGYKTNSAFSSSLGEQNAGSSLIQANSIMTGFIPYNKEIIRVCGYMNSDLHVSDYMVFYNSNFEPISDQRGRCVFYVESYAQTFEDETAFDGVKRFTFNLDTMLPKSSYYGNIIKNEAKYVRFSLYNPDITKTVIALGEDIVIGTENKWINTGREFVPSDCEDRIIPLEKTAEDHESRIKTLELYGADSVSSEDIPAYIKTEADGALTRLTEVQGNRTFNLIALSDFHYGGQGDNKDNLIRACKAISYIKGRMHIDAIATLGDNTPFGASSEENMKTAHRWFKEINEILEITQGVGIVNFRTPGNHDRLGGNDNDGNTTDYMPDNAIYSYIGGFNRQSVIGDVPGGWCYHDFIAYKLRVIVLNTSECEGKGRFSEYSGFRMSTKQYEWLIATLDLSDKIDAEDWQILILSHHRADDWSEPTNATDVNAYILPNILNAYQLGTSYAVNRSDGSSVSCDFAGKNKAKIIGNIHGHHHNYKWGNLYLGNTGNSDQFDMLAIGTPTTSFGVDKNADNDGNTYTSVKGTAQETAFCLYSIDLDNHIIHAIHYGAGCDREVNY